MKVVVLRNEKKNLLEKLKIPNRINGGTDEIQYNAFKILDKTLPMVPKDAYCMLTVLMEDLYPYDTWNYVFGWANYKSRIGVFSFKRFTPEFNELEGRDSELVLLRNACIIMVHEIGHMFGLKHCIYYECTMNGINHFEEQNRKMRDLCPVCIRKL